MGEEVGSGETRVKSCRRFLGTHQVLNYAALKLTLLHTRAFEVSLPTVYVTSSGLTETRRRLAYFKKHAGEFECSTVLASYFATRKVVSTQAFEGKKNRGFT